MNPHITKKCVECHRVFALLQYYKYKSEKHIEELENLIENTKNTVIKIVIPLLLQGIIFYNSLFITELKEWSLILYLNF